MLVRVCAVAAGGVREAGVDLGSVLGCCWCLEKGGGR